MKHIATMVTAFALASPALANELSADGSLKLTGFYSLTAAKVLSGSALGSSTPWTYQQWKCPCTIQGWEYTGVYEQSKGWQADQESLLGLQLQKEFSPTLSGTVQVVTRARNPNRGNAPTVDWAYLSWQPQVDSPWTFQAGRFRIPLYYYSDFLYIGYAYPWVRPAPDVYGWPIYAYQGANLSYRTQLGQSDWAATVHMWTGSYTQHNDAYDTLIYYTTPTHESWKNIFGAYATASNGIVDVRVMMMRYKDTLWQDNGTFFVKDQSTRIMGVAANLDYQNWLVKTEVDRYEQVDASRGLNGVYKYALLGVGYQYGQWLPMLTFSRYRTVAEPIEGRNSRYLSLRWDFRRGMALKAQYDITTDKSHYSYPFFGDSKLFSVSLQGTF